jgi:hypothetical protein
MPNYYQTIAWLAVQIAAMAVFAGLQAVIGGTSPLPYAGVTTRLQAKKVSILMETILVFASFIGNLRFEQFAPAFCTGHDTSLQAIISAAILAPFAFIAVRQCNAPVNLDAVTRGRSRGRRRRQR